MSFENDKLANMTKKLISKPYIVRLYNEVTDRQGQLYGRQMAAVADRSEVFPSEHEI